MTQQFDSHSPLHRRRQFLKSLAAAAGLAAMATEQALGSSLLLRAAQDEEPPADADLCTLTFTKTYSQSRGVLKTQVMTVDLPPGPPGTFTMTGSLAFTTSYSVVQTYTSIFPPGCSVTLTEEHIVSMEPAKTISFVSTFSCNGTGWTITASRAFAHTVSETLKETHSGVYPCNGDKSLGASEDAVSRLLLESANPRRRQTIDSKEDLFHIIGRGRGLSQVNL